MDKTLHTAIGNPDWTEEIDSDHPAALYCFVIDKDGNILKDVKCFNNGTKEAWVIKRDESGRVVTEWEDPNDKSFVSEKRKIVTEKVILDGARIVFKKVK